MLIKSPEKYEYEVQTRTWIPSGAFEMIYIFITIYIAKPFYFLSLMYLGSLSLLIESGYPV